MRTHRSGLLVLTATLSVASFGCSQNSTNSPPYPGPYGYQQPYGQPGYAPGQPQYQAPPQGAPGGDPINAVDIGWLRSEAGTVMNTLIAALPPAAQAKVQGIPMVPDPTPGDVNAFAGCDDQNAPFMAVTDGLLDVEAHISQYKAIDEIWGSTKVAQYEQLLAQQLKDGAPIPRPPPGFSDPSQDVDARKVARQHQIMDEQLAFVFGHELSHHHLGHTGCANGQGGSRGFSPGDLPRFASRAIPLFNQPNEFAADVSGTQNLLTAGSRMQGYKWTENGAILTLQFFAALQALTPSVFLAAFEQTHPFPQLRLPLVQQTATNWRLTGGQGLLQLPNLGGFLPQ